MHNPYVAAALVSVQRTEIERELAHRFTQERRGRRSRIRRRRVRGPSL
ncbi:hypothetical protein [Nocardioides caldifontis]|nr:hypothetical protein [Nocardioides caldifontis]